MAGRAAALVAAAPLALLSGASAAPISGAVIMDPSAPHGVRYVAGASPAGGALAWATYDEAAVNETGWSVLDLHANVSLTNDTLAGYSAGYLEGSLTWRLMQIYADNIGATEKNSKRLQKFLDANWAWMAEQVVGYADSDPYWAHVGALLAQLTGLADGQLAAGGSLTLAEVYNAIILGGDIFNLGDLYGASPGQLARTGALQRMQRRSGAAAKPRSHCSALIRVLPGNEDLFAAHTTWSGLENMNRIMKRYDLPFPVTGGGVPVPGRHTALSGFPAMLQYSSDDFYVLSSGLITLETTINNNNETLAQQFASDQVILEWARNILANRLATDARSWASVFSRYASGTYTNSWMIVDTHKFTPRAPVLLPDTLLVVEEMPGHISAIDRTPVLQAQGFWSSYNVASDPFIYNISDSWADVWQYGGPEGPGSYYTFGNTSRHNIFARDAPGVVDEAGVQRIIRYNDFEHDPLSREACGSNPPYAPTNSIADRSDLAKKGGDYLVPDLEHGDSAGIDAKYTAASWLAAADIAAGALPLAAQAGPTYDQQPAFNWANTSLHSVRHAGQVDVWRFPWVRQPWAV